MLSPNELKKKNFTRSLRGYNPIEVDDYIDFLIKKYSEVYRKNEELERNIKIITAKLQEISDSEAKRKEKEIIAEATEQAEIITKSAKQNCERILADFKAKIKDERITLHKLREQVKQFKQRIFEAYQIHIEYLEQLAPTLEKEIEWELDEGDFVMQVLDQMKLDITAANEEKEEIKPETLEKTQSFTVIGTNGEIDNGETKTFTAIKNPDFDATIAFDFSKEKKLTVKTDEKASNGPAPQKDLEATLVIDKLK
jgi:cell division initiation protein